ncbi:MAG: bacterial transcriptional activator domain-containing protein [Chloroflexota bacterium]
MEPFLDISLLGRVEIKQANQSGGLSTRKAEALLIYLVCNQQAHSRDVLTAMFWPEHAQNQARRYFRNTLYRLRQSLNSYIISTRQTVAFDYTQAYQLDVASLEKPLQSVRDNAQLTHQDAARLAEALDLYQGDFLAGFHVDNSPDFEGWVTLERERLHHLALEGIHWLIAYQLTVGDYAEGIKWGQRLLALDEFDEMAHKQMLQLLTLNNQRGAALTHYDRYAQALDTELGVEPGPALQEIAAQVRDGTLERLAAVPTQVTLPPQPASPDSGRPDPYSILARLDPMPSQHLFGIDRAQANLQEKLEQKTPAWLIAIDGIGGIGKTTLAQALVHALVHTERFYDIGWVSAKQEEFLPGVGVQATDKPALTEESLTDALLQQLDSRLYLTASHQEKRLALIKRLKQESHLIVVDNLESVVDYQSLLPFLHQLANPSKVLITSRHSLKTQADVYSLSISELNQPDALALLRHQAEVQGINSLLNAAEAQLDRIYEVVGGNPLALKMVVGQISFLPLGRVLESLNQAEGKSVNALYSYIYWQAWHMMSAASQQLLLNLPLSPNSTYLDLLDESPLEELELQQALNELTTLSMVEVGGNMEEPSYRLHRLTETFLLQEVLNWEQKLSGESDES